jgi:L-2-hydroxyglutarate oxidase
MSYDFVIVGAGLVGLATCHALNKAHPDAKVLLIDKELTVGFHQSGRNSGVIHSGLYYVPGSFKAKFTSQGRKSLVAFCQEHGVRFEMCGKLVVATDESELPQLEKLRVRGLENGVELMPLGAKEAREIEPHVACVQSLWVKSTGICDYRGLARKLQELVTSAGTRVVLGQPLLKAEWNGSTYDLQVGAESYQARHLINCAGLHSDRVARLAGLDTQIRIVPFRGEYYELVPDRRHLVRGLIYPVPNPDFPFLGVHLTRDIDGGVHAGPNAVLALSREGYDWSRFNLHDLAEMASFKGLWKFGRKHLAEGMSELRRSFSKNLFTKSLQRLVPELRAQDLVKAGAGVRAQAMRPDGKLVDDFWIEKGANATHVLNAPSPAATSSLEIGKHILNVVAESLG